MSDQRLVMALLEEGNPAIELEDDAWTEMNAATYLATIERRSSGLTQLETKKSQGGSKRPSTTRWLVAAIAVIALGVAGIVVRSGGSAIPLTGDEGDPQAVEAFKAVEAAYSLFNTGDPAWIEIRLRGSFFDSPQTEDEIATQLALFHARQAANADIEVSGCVSRGHGEWPDVVDSGVPAPVGHHFICEATTSDSLKEPAGIRLAETYLWVVDDGTVVAVRTFEDTTEQTDFVQAFHDWLEETHPDVFANMVFLGSGTFDFFPDAESVPAALEYLDEFLAQSDIYPLTTSGS
ncbi:MAG: hypothetical protein WD895_04835 [Acidimicrobiia bacterium]